MKTTPFVFALLFCSILISCGGNGNDFAGPQDLAANHVMYVIERNIPGAGSLSAEELKAISQTSCTVLKDMGSEIQWIHSYVAVDKIYCVYTAPNEEMIREHAKQGGFPANSVSRVSAIIDPSSAGD